jgi:hypothetical protein
VIEKDLVKGVSMPGFVTFSSTVSSVCECRDLCRNAEDECGKY